MKHKGTERAVAEVAMYSPCPMDKNLSVSSWHRIYTVAKTYTVYMLQEKSSSSLQVS